MVELKPGEGAGQDGSFWDDGVRLELAGDLNGAASAYAQAEAAGEEPRHSLALLCHGEFMEHSDRLREAEQAFREASVSANANVAARAWHCLHRCALKKGDIDGAETALRSLVATGDPEEAPRGHRNLGTLLEDHRQDAAGARRHYELAIESGHPMHVQGARVNLAQLAERDGKANEAADLFEQVIVSEHPAEGPRALCLYGSMLADLGEPGRALKKFTSAMGAGNPEWAARAALEAGHIYLSELGDLDRAASAFELAEQIPDADGPQVAAFFRGILERDRGRDGDAEIAFRRVIEHARGEPTSVACSAAKNLATMALQRSDLAEARRYLGVATLSEDAEQRARAFLLLGLCETQAGDRGRAVDAFQAAATTPAIPEEVRDMARQNLANLGL